MRWIRAGTVAVTAMIVALACNKGDRGENKADLQYTDSAPVQAQASLGYGQGGGAGKGSVAPEMAARVAAPAPGSVGGVSSDMPGVTDATQQSIPSQSSMPIDAIAPMIVRTGSATMFNPWAKLPPRPAAHS